MRVGDARDLLSQGIERGTVDCVITSPPYWHLKQYGEGDRREIGSGSASFRDYLEAVGSVLEDCYELTKPTGVLWLIVDTFRQPARGGGPGEIAPLPFDLAAVARDKQWRFQDIVIWEKNKTLPYSGTGKLRNLTEYILFFTKGQDFKHRPFRVSERHMPGAEWLAGWPERYHPLGRRPANIWQFDIETQGMWDHSERLHYCPFPQELVARCIDLTTDKGDLVLDPFAGIGTVPAQAIAMGRRGVGVELNPESVRVFEDRLLAEFQAAWEGGSEYRRLSREDQLAEALMILRLRLLKAGKELMRVVDRLAQSGSSTHPAHGVESVLVVEPHSLEDYIRIEAGFVGRPPARLVLVGHFESDDIVRLRGDIEPVLARPPFTTFGLDTILDLQDPNVAFEAFDRILQFGQSRQGAYTAELDGRLFPTRPRLLTTVELKAAVDGSKNSPLEKARIEAERQLLQRELATGAPLDEIALRVGLPQADLRARLVKYELLERPRSFAISLPNQLAIAGE
jgi:DNA modification methylase